MPRHGHMGPQGADEKAKDLKGTLKKLLHYMSVFKVQMLLIVIFAVCGTTFTIIGPKIPVSYTHLTLPTNSRV